MASNTSNSNAPAVDLDAVIQGLPACKRCRECRRGCDTLLPKCRQCTKAGVDCVYYDHGRGALVPRSYISELVDHVRRLEAGNNLSPAASVDTPQSASLNAAAKPEPVLPGTSLQYEHHFAYAADSYRYLGSESCLLKSPRLQSTYVRSPFDEEDDFILEWKTSPQKLHELVEEYLECMQPVYPIIDVSQRYLSLGVPTDLAPIETFSLNMIYSIACHVIPNSAKRQDARDLWQSSGKQAHYQANCLKYRNLAGKFYNKAMDHVEAATLEPTIDTLRAVLLMAINSLFDPKSGNIGQQIALAARIAYSLGAKAEQEGSTPSNAEMLRNMHMTIFSIENEIASTLDRPATFPEPHWELSFDKTRPAEYMCSLFRLQHRFRNGDSTVKSNVRKLLPRLDEKAELLPVVRIALHTTVLLLDPSWGSAWYVLEAVVSLGGTYTFLTPHWVYRAGTIIIQNMPEIYEGNVIQLYSNTVHVLELSSWKWPSSAALNASLADLMTHMKSKYRPNWADKLRLGDVRI
ncbi:hypothetical protein BU25DRAFT_134098 [Macroventuria anomochaeta]|uniref:Uncharacterized protein n=1 Tax=Macroventuria anomochaeta TaxID=301207 RepID=A0ACB6RSM6_9PLEO|nr:uncharacterized protein BU25DRAFT_134098 [Macroventuria anomochaeta]KAF2624784.1 hypothetical protein BU25DRAFT_134098 [Macroventuria anomochaeta]